MHNTPHKDEEVWKKSREHLWFSHHTQDREKRFLSWKFSAWWLDYMRECRQLHYLHFHLLMDPNLQTITQIERIFLCPAQQACYKWSELRQDTNEWLARVVLRRQGAKITIAFFPSSTISIVFLLAAAAC